MTDESVERPESLKQRKRECPDIGRRDEGPYSAPIAQCELRMKGSRKTADGTKAYWNPERRAEWFAAPSPKGFAGLTLEEAPGCLPKAEAAQGTDSQMTAPANQPRKDRSNGVQIAYAIESSEVGDHSIKTALNAVELLDVEDRSIDATAAGDANHLG